MLNRPSKAVVTRVVGIVGVLVALSAFLMLSSVLPDSALAHPHDPEQMHRGVGTDVEHIHFDENDEGAVRTFMSTDPETGEAVDWDITGTDGDDFRISESGELTFKMSPDFEKPVDGLDADNDGDFPDTGDEARDNVYRITVRATEQETPGDPTGRALSTMTNVIIVVNNMDEDGMVELNYLQPEVGTEITAMLDDEDVVDTDTLKWEWSVSKVTNPDKDTEAHWANATGTVSLGTYIPTGVRDPAITPRPTPNSVTPVDEGEMLRAKASYTDSQGEMKTAIGVSMYPVRAEVNSDNDLVENADNGSPGFPDGLDYTRSVPESTDMGMDVGPAVVAQDPDSDTLSYMLVAVGPPNGMDVGFFDVNRVTGQLTVEKMLDHEAEDGRPYEATPPATAGEYKVIVRATDPSGESDNTTVTVTVTDANDDPVIRGNEELSVMEQDSDDGDDADSLPDKPYTGGPDMLVSQENTNANVYRASDDDERGTISWGDVSRSGFKEDDNDPEAEDWRLFVISSTDLTEEGEPRAIRFIDPPDYESPGDANRDNVYKVTLVAKDGGRGGKDEFRVSILVMNEHEQGELTLVASGNDPTQPVVGQPITAMVSDPDGGIAIVTWQWSRSDTKDGIYMPIPGGATSATYRPVSDADEGMYLRATATYLDTTSVMDDPGTGTFDERVQASVADAYTATTGDGSTNGDEKVYRVMATTEKAVRVGETDTTGPPPDLEPSAPVFSPVSYTGTVYENSEVGSLVMMSAMVSAGEDQELMLDPLDGDNKYFTIDQHGQIRVGEIDFPAPLPTGVEDVPTGATAPDMEDPVLDYETRSTYRLVVSAENEGGRSTANVVLSLMDRNEHPYFDKASRDLSHNAIVHAEDSTNRTVAGLSATEPDEDSLRWEVVGTDNADFEIVQAPDGDDGKDRVELRFKTGVRPDFERPMDRMLDLNFDGDGDDGTDEDPAGDNKYRITVRATEAATVGMVPPRATELDLTIMVQDAEETGEVQLNWRQPEVGTPITASLTDPDAVTTTEADGRVPNGGVTYKWFKAKVRGQFIDHNIENVPDAGNGQWEPIDVANSGFDDHTYTPQGAIPDDPDSPVDESDVADNVPVDEGWHLLAKATYTSDTPPVHPVTAIGISEFPVRPDVHDNLNNSPDFSAADTTREVLEDIDVDDPVGEVVDVDRNEDIGDHLTYQLVRTSDTTTNNGGAADGNSAVVVDDLAFFYIDRDTGQIRVKKPLDFEAHDALGQAEYTVVVRATDPSGEGMDDNSAGPDEDENRDDITVVITVTDVNEAPKVTDGYSIIKVKEMNESKELKDNGQYYIGLGNEALDAAPYTVTKNANNQNYYKKEDEDPVDSHDWPDNLIPGPDGQWFEYSTPTDGISRRLHFITPPDYEVPKDQNGDNVYEVCVTAIDNGDLVGCKMVRIEVQNVQEDGMLTLMPTEPEEGDEVEAMLTDPDGEVVITDWKWAQNPASGGEFGGATPKMGATMYKFRGELGKFVWAQVHYRDGASAVNDLVTALDERNDDPDTDTPTEQHKFQGRKDDGTVDNSDNSFHNSDEMLSKVTDSAVQALSGGPPTPDPDDTTTDPSGPPSVIDIQREVPENTPSTGYVGIPLEMAVFADESGMVRTMTGADANVFVFAEDVDTHNGNEGYYDGALTPTPDALDDKMGQLALAPVNHLDFEASKNDYIITFSDDAADSDVYRVTIRVTDVNEAPSMPEEARGGINITGPSNISRYDEDRMDVVADYGTTGGDSMATVTWALSGGDMDDLSINSDGELTFDMVPDFENPMDSAMNNIYSVTVEAEQGTNHDSVFVTVTVGNVDEDGVVTVDPMGRPAVDREITAMLEDADGVMGTVMWQWASADAMGGTYTDIDMATMYTYTPMAGAEDDDMDMGDVGMYLRVTATYEDGEGRGKMAMLELMGAVTDELSFDADVIERMVAEDAMAGDNVGEPVMAAGGLASQLTYSLDGADASSFTIDVMGQIMVGTGTDLDYETKVTYTVMVTARGTADDGTVEVAMTTVTVTVTNVDEDETVGPEPDGGILAMYDANDNSLIERSEAVDAVLDFLILNEITRDQAIEVVTAFILQTAVP